MKNVTPLAKKIVDEILGQPIHYAILLDFGNFSKLIDALGGVDVTVDREFDDYKYPIPGKENDNCQGDLEYLCRYEHIHFDAGLSHFDGEKALKFVRSRNAQGDEGTDFARSARQFAVLEGIRNKLVSIQSSEKLEKTINTVSNIVRTDLTAGTIKTLIGVFASPDSYEISRIQLTTENVLVEGKSADGQYILRPKAGSTNYTELKSYIAENL